MSGNDRYHTYQGPMPGGGYQALCSQTQDPDTQHWVLTILLPWVLASTNRKTRHTELKQGYHNTQQAHARFLAHSFTHTETLALNSSGLIGQYGCAKFQRSTSWHGSNQVTL